MSHLKIIVPAFILSGFLITTNIAQADYQNEIGLFTSQTEDEDNDTSDGTTLFYTYYYNNVDTSKGPWAEAAFINRAGNVGISLSNSESTLATTTKLERSGSTISADISSPESDLVFSAGYASTKSDYKNGLSYSSESTDYSLGIGYFIQQYTLVTFTRDESETKYSGLSQTFNYDSETNSIGVKALLLRSDTTALVLNASHSIREDSDDDEFKSTLLLANYYLNPQLGVGGYLVKYSGNVEASKGNLYAITMNYFLNPKFQIGLLYSKFKPDNEKGTESEVTQLTGSYYFQPQ